MQRGLAEPTPAALRETHPESCQVDVAGGTREDANPQGGRQLPGAAAVRSSRGSSAGRGGAGRASGDGRQSPSGTTLEPRVQGGVRGPHCPPRSSVTPAAREGGPLPGLARGASATSAPSPGAVPGLLPPFPSCPTTAGQLSPSPVGTPGAGKAPGQGGRSPTCGPGCRGRRSRPPRCHAAMLPPPPLRRSAPSCHFLSPRPAPATPRRVLGSGGNRIAWAGAVVEEITRDLEEASSSLRDTWRICFPQDPG